MPEAQTVYAVLNALMTDSFTLRELRKDAEAEAQREAATHKKAGGTPMTPLQLSKRIDVLTGKSLLTRAFGMTLGFEVAEKEIFPPPPKPEVGDQESPAPKPEAAAEGPNTPASELKQPDTTAPAETPEGG